MRITSKGQVTIPKKIRDSLGWFPGTEVEFYVEDGVARVRKVQGGQTRGRKAVEHLRQAGRRAEFTMTTEEIMRLTRGEDWGTGHLEEGDGDPA